MNALVCIGATLTLVLLVSSQMCRESPNSTQFEQQFEHLPKRRVVVPSMSPYNYTIDNSACNPLNQSAASPMFLSERSLCPWDVVPDVNNNRYPPVISMARCKCSRCLGHRGLFECKALFYRIPVVEKICRGGVYEYIKTFLDVPIGCICAVPRMVRLYVDK